MLHLRGSLLRALPAAAASVGALPTVAQRSFVSVALGGGGRGARIFNVATRFAGLTRPQRSATLTHALRRGYATEHETEEQSDKVLSETEEKDVGEVEEKDVSTFETSETVSGTSGTASTTIDDALEKAESSADSFTDEVKERASSAAESVRQAAGDLLSGAGAYVNPNPRRGGGGGGVSSRDDSNRTGTGDRASFASSPDDEPSAEEAGGRLFIGNLFFEVDESAIKREFERYGSVESVRIIRDVRGLSKGYAFVQMSSVEEATAARNNLGGQILAGRNMRVLHSLSRLRTAEQPPPQNAPTNTLFIGNIAYSISDKELNELFKDVKNVTDVRVAIDRRTGVPRGFAHADFVDVASAEAAAEVLREKSFGGRRLRIDFSARPGRSEKP